jgi:cell division protein ZapA
MDRRPIDLRVAGQSYRVMSTAPEEDLRRLAQMVDAKVAELSPRGRTLAGQAGQGVLLAAIALAHEVEAERGRREALERRTRELLQRVLGRIDAALEPLDAADVAEND